LFNTCPIYRLVKGVTVQQYLNSMHGSEGNRKREGKMMTTATQLLEVSTDVQYCCPADICMWLSSL